MMHRCLVDWFVDCSDFLAAAETNTERRSRTTTSSMAAMIRIFSKESWAMMYCWPNKTHAIGVDSQ